jgi:hypothetical protein
LRRSVTFIFTLIALISLVFTSNAQDSLSHRKLKKVIQFSGLIVGGDSLYGIPGVTIYVPAAGRGTYSNSVGYFSMPALVGDSVVIKAFGYSDRKYPIPSDAGEELSVIIEMKEDTMLLPAISILPWPTERLFKEAFLSLKLPQEEMDNMHKNLNEQVMKRMLYTMDHDGAMNHRYFMQQQVQRQEIKMTYVNPWMSLMNPFAWSKFIKQIKNGEHKDQSPDDYEYEKEDE